MPNGKAAKQFNIKKKREGERVGNALKDEAVVDFVVDKNTGEIKDSIMVGDKVNITRRKKMEYLENTIEIPFKKFVKLNTDEISILAYELNKYDFAFLIAISKYVGYCDNCVKNRRGNPMSIDEIAEILNMPRSTVYKSINRLMEENILCKAKTSEFQLYVCPYILCKGNRANKVLQTMFRNYKIRSLGGVKWKKLLKRDDY